MAVTLLHSPLFIRAYIEPSAVTKKRKAPAKIVPIATVDAMILDRFLASNNDARALVERASRYDVNRLRFQNPFVPVIFFTVGTGLEILWRHQRRHLLQAERIRQSAEFPAEPQAPGPKPPSTPRTSA